MNDMTSVIAPKVDELTADHLLGGPITIRITNVTVKPGTERPVTINYENDAGLPFKPCKSVSRIFVAAWGPDASKYVGKSATLYRDATVRWGGMEVGGIRISHMSDIQRDLVLALTATKGKKALTTVKPLRVQEPIKPEPQPSLTIEAATELLEGAADLGALRAVWTRKAMAPFRNDLLAVLDRRKGELTPPADDASDDDTND